MPWIVVMVVHGPRTGQLSRGLGLSPPPLVCLRYNRALHAETTGPRRNSKKNTWLAELGGISDVDLGACKPRMDFCSFAQLAGA